MPHFKLHYFNLRGRGQILRLIFAVADVPFEDYRISPAQWFPEGGLKTSMVIDIEINIYTVYTRIYSIYTVQFMILVYA